MIKFYHPMLKGNKMPKLSPKFLWGKRILISIITIVSFIFIITNYAQAGESLVTESNRLLLPSPNIKFGKLTIEDGLEENFINDVIQTSDGYIWIISQLAIHRYDGYNFKIIKNDPDDPNSINLGPYWQSIEDSNGNLWFAGDYGIDRFEIQTETVTHFINDPDKPSSFSGSTVQDIFEDSNGNIWIATKNNGLDSYSPTTDSFTHYRFSDASPISISSDHTTSVMEDNLGNIWVGTDGMGLNKLDPSTGEFTTYLNNPLDISTIASNYISTLMQDKEGNIWIGTKDSGLLLFDPDHDIFFNNNIIHGTNKKIEATMINSITQDSDGSLWIGTWSDGIYFLNQDADYLIHFEHDPDNPSSISNNGAPSIWIDDSGIVWIATNDGINYYDKHKYKFTAHTPNSKDPNSLIGPLVYGIDNDPDGNLYFAVLGYGLDYYDFSTDTYTHYLVDPNDNSSLPSDVFQSMMVDSTGIVWLGTWGDGLIKFDPTSGEFKTYKNALSDSGSISHNEIWGMLEDSDGTIWIGTYGRGLNKYNSETDNFTHYFHDSNDPTTINSDGITYIYEDSLGEIWVGTLVGLNHFDKETGIFTRFVQSEDENLPVVSVGVPYITEDSAANLWIASIEGGFKFNREDNTFLHFTENDGLPSNIVTGVQVDQDDIVWFCTFNGISRFDPDTNTFLNYTEADGLPTNTCRAPYKAEDGQIYFGNQGGYVSFYPEDIIDNTYVPQIVISDFYLFNEPVNIGVDSILQKSISYIDEITLDYSDSVFSLEFASLHYSDPESNQYAYMLEGFDEDWIYTTSDYRRATYTNLDGGEYTFRVKGTNSDGVWNEEGTSLKINITPPFWETAWFRLIILVLISGGVFIGVRLRLRSSESRRRELEDLVTQKTEELKLAQEEIVNQEKLAVLGRLAGSVSHELRNPLGVITNSIYFLKNSDSNISQDMIDKYYDIISYEANISVKIISDLLDYGRDVEPQIKKNSISELISTSLAKNPLSEDSEIKLNINITPEDITAQFDTFHLELALKNLFENAYQAMEYKGTLTIDSYQENEFVKIEISDTGEGIPEEHINKIFKPLFSTKIRGFGLGLSVSRKYIEANNGRIEFTSKEGEGTIFTIYLLSS